MKPRQKIGRRRVKLIRKSMLWAILLFVVTQASGCAVLSGSYCDLEQPIWWSDMAELEATPTPIVRQVVRHNERYQAVCK